MDSNRFLVYPLEHLPFILLVLVIAFTLHEFAHAYSAYKFGDMTAYNAGRVTLNPMSHLDVLGTILILIAGFGWAKPVPVNRGRFKHPRLMGIVVSAVGPLSNLLLAFIAAIGIGIMYKLGLWTNTDPSGSIVALKLFLTYMIGLNALLFLFNLIPLPPLDGYRIIEDLAPIHTRIKMQQYEQWGIFAFLIMAFIPPINRVTLQPILMYTEDIKNGLLRFVGMFL
ncbi:site-2 protease family protein [Paenibacillus koleovorans]|uniref:site-2 protease family protein n=1 Tax=Paenibacillus koleovorans TaxID=121608 RepID=UPI000FDA2D6C|nr:site-2 protease family protein [Paenibacillus koleovorans]